MSTRTIAAGVALLAVCAAAGADDLRVELATGGDQWVAPDRALELRFDRAPRPDDGRVAVTLGATDVTDLFRREGNALVYRPELLPLPAGERDLAVYLVSGPEDAWREVGRWPLKVLTAAGFRRSELTSRVDLGVVGQVDEGHSPASNAPGRTSYQDGTLRLESIGAWTRERLAVDTSVHLVGVTHRPEALRFAEEGDDAPKLDLSSYSIKIARERAWLQLGQVNFGAERHLVNGFTSRGAQLWLPLGDRGEAWLAGANGSQVVGWSNPVGLAENDHRILAGALALELLPARPGGLRLEATYLDGSLLPRFGYNERDVNDAETSRGWAVRALASTPNQRLRFEGGWARSRFDNPFDATLAQGSDLVPVRSETRDAFFFDVSAALLRKTRADGRATNLDLDLRHERVDPLFRSVAASAQADLEQSAAELRGATGPVAFALRGSRSEDNLDELPSILTTKTRRSAGSLTVPLAQVGRKPGEASPWLPTFSYTVDRTHQYGSALPTNADFAASHVPDQVSLSQSGGLDWQGAGWRLAYRLDLSDQDNRQTGRQNADFDTAVHSLGVALAAGAELDVGLDLARDSSENHELAERESTRRLGANFQWRPTSTLTFAGSLSRTERHDERRTRESEATGLDLQGTWRFGRERGSRHGWSGQLFLRYADQDAESRDRVFGFDTDTESWALTTGLTLSIH